LTRVANKLKDSDDPVAQETYKLWKTKSEKKDRLELAALLKDVGWDEEKFVVSVKSKFFKESSQKRSGMSGWYTPERMKLSLKLTPTLSTAQGDLVMVGACLL
jgi:hypothetical protein